MDRHPCSLPLRAASIVVVAVRTGIRTGVAAGVRIAVGVRTPSAPSAVVIVVVIALVAAALEAGVAALDLLRAEYLLEKAVKVVVDDKVKYTDWSRREDIKAELKVDLILVLADHGYPPVDRDEVYKEIYSQAENYKKHRNRTG